MGDQAGVPRLAVLCDFREEHWPSMDLVGDMLVGTLRSDFANSVSASAFCPPFRRSSSRVPILGGRGAARNVERLLNRMVHYPRAVRRIVPEHDAFHVADHSYAQLVHSLPAARTGVFCHDLDTFKSILQPAAEPRPRWFRVMTRRILTGMQKASVVFYSTAAVRERIDRQGVIDGARLVHAPYGTSPEFDPEPLEVEPARKILEGVWGDGAAAPFMLHVGSCIPRKRIDILLQLYSEVRRRRPEVRLLQIGGEWTEAQREQIGRLGIGGSIAQRRGLSREQLASLYRSAEVVLQPSEAEGFGLPVIEALACGAVVVASDITVLREVGGAATLFCPVGDIARWTEAVTMVLDEAAVPLRAERLAWASRYSWQAHAETVLNAYLRLLS